MRNLYSSLFYLALPFIFFRLWWKGRRTPGYRQRWRERLALIPALPERQGCVWVHAVSLGEMIAAKPLILALQKGYPDYNFVITNMTVTGSGMASQLKGENIFHFYVPYDLPDVVERFLERARPSMAIIMETELWPNLLHYTAAKGIPIFLANARLSDRSLQGYKRIRSLVTPMLQSFILILAQTQEEARRFIELGADPQKVQVTGSIKFDVPLPTELVAKGRALRVSWGERRPTLIAASTHGGEEEKILRAFAELRAVWPTALLVLVPRHPERFNEVALLCQKHNFQLIRRTQNLPCQQDTAVFLGDTLGELFAFYALADIAFVGGSFVAVGGHNLLEPAALALPIITGPNLFNFTEIFNLLNQVGAVVQVEDEQQLVEACEALLAEPERGQEMGTRALKVVEQNRGALQKHLDYIEATS